MEDNSGKLILSYFLLLVILLFILVPLLFLLFSLLSSQVSTSLIKYSREILDNLCSILIKNITWILSGVGISLTTYILNKRNKPEIVIKDGYVWIKQNLYMDGPYCNNCFNNNCYVKLRKVNTAEVKYECPYCEMSYTNVPLYDIKQSESKM